MIDVTGVGKPVFEMFSYSGISPLGVLITAGASETWHDDICGVPKLTLVSRLQALMHQARLKIHRELAEAETLVTRGAQILDSASPDLDLTISVSHAATLRFDGYRGASKHNQL